MNKKTVNTLIFICMTLLCSYGSVSSAAVTLILTLEKTPTWCQNDFQGGKIVMQSNSASVFNKVRLLFLDPGLDHDASSMWFYPKIEAITSLNILNEKLSTLSFKDLDLSSYQEFREVTDSFQTSLAYIKADLKKIHPEVNLDQRLGL